MTLDLFLGVPINNKLFVYRYIIKKALKQLLQEKPGYISGTHFSYEKLGLLCRYPA
jgi:hypothetical protein